MYKLTRAQLLQAIKLARDKGEGPDLRRVNLDGANLSGVDLRGANLRGALLGGADLRIMN